MCVYIRELTNEQFEQLEDLSRCSDTATYRRARIALLSAQERKVWQMTEALGMHWANAASGISLD